MHEQTEQWRSLAEVLPFWGEFYEASDHGRVRSIDRVISSGSRSMNLKSRVLRQSGREGSGHLLVSLCHGGPVKKFYVHRLVAFVFLGDRSSEGLEVCHEDGKPSNNRPENLRWDTHAGNLSDMIRHGTSTRGERSGTSKITEAQAIKVRDSTETLHVVARRFRISPTTVREIRTGRTWGHLGPSRIERRSSAKLTREQVFEILDSTETQIVTAARFGVSQSSVSKIRRGLACPNLGVNQVTH